MSTLPELRQLRYFVAVAEELNFTRAAKRLNLAQPPLSAQIKRLERALGVSLFERTSRHVELTPAGKALLTGARRTLAEAQRTVASSQHAGMGQVDTLRVGITDSAALSVLTRIVRPFRTEFPTVYLDLRDGTSLGQIEAVRADAVDVALTRGPVSESTLTVEVLVQERLCLAVSDRHPLARRRQVMWAELSSQPMILFPRQLAPAFHDLIMAGCQRAGFSPNVAYEASEIQTILSFVAAELGVAVVAESVRNARRAGVIIRPLGDAPVWAPLLAICRPERKVAALTAFLRYARMKTRAE